MQSIVFLLNITFATFFNQGNFNRIVVKSAYLVEEVKRFLFRLVCPHLLESVRSVCQNA